MRRVLFVVPMLMASLATADWPQWRGPARDGVATGATPRTWPAALKRAWSVPVGIGHAAPVVVGDRVYVFARNGEEETLQALDLATGRTLWKQGHAAPFTVNSAAYSHGAGPKATPAVGGGRVVTFGISGILSAHDAATGRLLWRKNPGQFPDGWPSFGAAQSPLLDGDRVILHWGGDRGGALTAFDAATGGIRWAWGDDQPGYASPVLATIGGLKQVVTLTRNRLVGVDAGSGRLLWSLPFTTPYEQNAVTPLVSGDLVVYGGIDHPVRAVRIAKRGQEWKAEPAWENPDVSTYMSSPVAHGGRIFGFSMKKKGQLFALDAATGRTVWLAEGRQGDNASLAIVGGALVALTTEGELLVVDASAPTFRTLHRWTVASSPTWAHVGITRDGLLAKDETHLTSLRF